MGRAKSHLHLAGDSPRRRRADENTGAANPSAADAAYLARAHEVPLTPLEGDRRSAGFAFVVAGPELRSRTAGVARAYVGFDCRRKDGKPAFAAYLYLRYGQRPLHQASSSLYYSGPSLDEAFAAADEAQNKWLAVGFKHADTDADPSVLTRAEFDERFRAAAAAQELAS